VLRRLPIKAPKRRNIEIFLRFGNTARQDASAHKNVKLFFREPYARYVWFSMPNIKRFIRQPYNNIPSMHLMCCWHEQTKCNQRMMDKTVLNLTADVAAGRFFYGDYIDGGKDWQAIISPWVVGKQPYLRLEPMVIWKPGSSNRFNRLLSWGAVKARRSSAYDGSHFALVLVNNRRDLNAWFASIRRYYGENKTCLIFP
jgi:hypothetical protein